MGKVVDLNPNPHLSGTAICVACKHEWEAVAPLGTFESLECPACELPKGVMKYGVSQDVRWTCSCGCWLFSFSGDTGSALCWQCGVVQSFD